MRNTHITSVVPQVGRIFKRLFIIVALAFFMLPAAGSLTSLAMSGSFEASVSAQAQKTPECKDNQAPVEGGAPALPCQKNDVSSCPQGSCIFQTYINPAIKVVSALVGIGVTISIIIGGIQYASSADSPQKVSAAKQRIVKAIFILLAYFFFLAFMNWIIPGGINGTP